MRANGVRVVIAACEACGHKADVNVDALPETTFVPEVGRRLRCSACGGSGSIRAPPGTAARPGAESGPPLKEPLTSENPDFPNIGISWVSRQPPIIRHNNS